jgi:hypothetical protein
VLSPTTRDFDAFRELEEYKPVASLAHILLIEPNEPMVALWSRDDLGSWRERRMRDLEATLDFPALGCALSLSDIYDDVTFPRIPRIVGDDSPG